jgi:hypothetical protein
MLTELYSRNAPITDGCPSRLASRRAGVSRRSPFRSRSRARKSQLRLSIKQAKTRQLPEDYIEALRSGRKVVVLWRSIDNRRDGTKICALDVPLSNA